MAHSETHKFKPGTLDHIHIISKDCKKTMEIWERMFDIGPWDIRGALNFAYMDNGVELLVSSWEGKEEGVDHLGFKVDDLEAEVANLVAQGAKVIGQRPGQWAYIDSGAPGGVIFEFIQKRKPSTD